MEFSSTIESTPGLKPFRTSKFEFKKKFNFNFLDFWRVAGRVVLETITSKVKLYCSLEIFFLFSSVKLPFLLVIIDILGFLTAFKEKRKIKSLSKFSINIYIVNYKNGRPGK